LKSFLYIFYILIVVFVSSCSPTLRKSFSKVSSPEKTWTFFHPFKAKRAFFISLEAEKVKDSIKKDKIIGTDNNGGKLDAFKHSYWMARLTQGIGRRASCSLGKAHEKGNYKSFIKRKLEDGYLPDKPSSDMDLFNNQVGISVGNNSKTTPQKLLIEMLLDSIKQGRMRILLKDKKGNFLDCQQKIIPLDSLKYKWNTKKCLVTSDNS